MHTNTININADSSGDYVNLDKAVEAADFGDTIVLSEGEHWLDYPLVINKSIQLIGAGSDTTLLMCQGKDCVVEFEGPGIFQANGIAFWHDGKAWADVVRVSGGKVAFKACRFTGGTWSDDAESGGDGLIFTHATGGSVQECEFYDNQLHGIEVSNEASPVLEANLCANNKENGIAYFDEAGGSARNNRCEGNGLIGIAVNGTAAPALENNFCVRNRETGMGYFERTGGQAVGNTCQENDLYGLLLQDEADPRLESNSLDKNSVANLLDRRAKGFSKQSVSGAAVPPSSSIQPASSQVIQERTIIAGAASGFADLADAIQSAGENGTVKLPPGGYLLDRPITLRQTIRLVGSGQDATFVICREEGFVVEFDCPGLFQAEGITFRHEGNQWADVLRIANGEVDISHCRFTGGIWSDSAEKGGDGLVLSGSARGSVHNCEASNNALHGIEIGDQAHPSLEENVLVHNDEDGIAFFESAGGKAIKNRCEDNSLFGIAVNDQAHPDLVENVCSRNGEAGIAFFNQSSGTASSNWCEENADYGLEITDQAAPFLVGNLCNHNLGTDISNTSERAPVSSPVELSAQDTKRPDPAVSDQPTEDVFVTVGLDGGFTTLEEALRSVGAGAMIHLSTGEHILTRPLWINQAIRLVGEGIDKTLIQCDGEGCVISFTGPGLLSAEGITFHHQGREWADCVAISGGEVDFLRCAFTGAVNDRETARGGNGLALSGNVLGSIARCEAIRNQKNGILVSDHAQPALLANICRQNKEAGIAFSAASSGLGRENHCLTNSLCGILVTGQAHPTLRDNTCVQNDGDGIAYDEESSGTALENNCSGNQADGISICDSAAPVLESNTCHQNEASGLSFSGASRGTARENHCDDNADQGIEIKDAAQPMLESNACNHNGEAGIAYFDTSGGKAWGNQCEANRLYGIGAQDRSQPMVESNTCHQNKQAGISFTGSAWGVARENICTDNGHYGLSVTEAAHPEMVANECRDNWVEDVYTGQSSL